MSKPKKRTQRRYSPQERAAILASWKANGENTIRTAREHNMPPATLRTWVNTSHANNPHELVEKAEKDLKVLLEDAVRNLLGHALKKASTDEASFSQLMVGFGISFDKLRLLQGEATSIEESRGDPRVLQKVKDMTPEQLIQLYRTEQGAE